MGKKTPGRTGPGEKNQRCGGYQLNRKHPDFDCKLGANHGGPHIDSTRGIHWRERVPFIGRKKKGSST